ncbi:MAG TPA: tRNA (adenosine(37)-N6)-threonylcarbamoyltransferase complex transferase subunit TsaD [Epsilonproteobacteria bacterium]|nr:tRNA (adenosine(37)-N6)-threonylcarbamoyltransferase complex transferase subunit TsaD [Campylobacterota bacterium]
MILSIESSCDDSAIAITQIETKKLIFHRKLSQEKEHAHYGGVVPELASRLHTIALPEILHHAKDYLPSLKAIAVTNQPGLGVALLEGIAMAKTIAFLQKIPLIAVHHLKAHIYSLFIETKTHFPLLVLLISGGHTQILEVQDFDHMKILATTMDDSVGESFDKCAKMMGLGYPGGPIIETLAKEGDAHRFSLPIPLINSPVVAFSLSGLKNAVRLQIEALGGKENMSRQDRCDLAATFQHTLIAHLIHKSKKIFEHNKIVDFAIVGGAGANIAIRDAFGQLCNKYRKNLHTAPLAYCSDNAAMVGRYALDAYRLKRFTPLVDIAPLTTKKLTQGNLL